MNDGPFASIAREVKSWPGVTTGLDHVGIAVSDLERSERWYREVLGLEGVEGWGDYPVILLRGGSGVALFRADNDRARAEGAVRILHVAFRIADEDFDAIRQELEARGIAIETEDHHGIARSIYLADPDGHQIELIAYPAKARAERRETSENS